MKVFIKALLAVAMFGAGAHAGERTMQIADAWSRVTPPGLSVGVAYLVIRNQTGQDDVLLSAATPRAASVELHATKMSNGTSSMERHASLPIAAGAEIKMQPGGLHFMLMGLNTPLVSGERVPLTLQFAKAGTVEVDVAVRAIAK